jgi:hypothetical protein
LHIREGEGEREREREREYRRSLLETTKNMPASDRPRRSSRTARKSVEKEESKGSKESKTEDVVKDSLDDLIDSSDDSSSDGDEISKPWLKKRKVEEGKNKKPSSESQSGIPKKRKEEETTDESSKVKSEPSSLIASMAPPMGGGSGPSLIANMKPMQAKQQTIREWKSKDEYKALKAGKTVNKSEHSVTSNSLPPQKRDISPVPIPKSASASPVREQSDIENKMHKNLATLIAHVIDSQGKKTSSTPHVTSDSFLDIMHSAEESTTKGGIIDWVSFLSFPFLVHSFESKHLTLISDSGWDILTADNRRKI